MNRWLRTLRLMVALALSLIVFPAMAIQAQFVGQKQGNKTQSRWTITDYLAQKQRVRLMDHWLAVNRSANLFEFYVSGGPTRYDFKVDNGTLATKTTQDSQSYRLAMFVSIFGLEAEYEKTNHDQQSWGGNVALRVLGTSNQTTNLTLKYGLLHREDQSVSPRREWNNQFAEANLTLYLIQALGLQGGYRHYFPDENDTGVDLRGHRATAGAFIDLGFFRIYGEAFQERLEEKSGATVTKKDRDGLEYGARIFF